jgi:hypothetical protein
MTKSYTPDDIAEHASAVLSDVFGGDFHVHAGYSDTDQIVLELRWIDGPPVPLVGQVIRHALIGPDSDFEIKMMCARGYSQWRFSGARAMLAERSERPELLTMSAQELAECEMLVGNGEGRKAKVGVAFSALLDSMMFEWDVPGYSEYLDPRSPKHWRNR